MDELVAIANKLSSVGLATLFLLALLGNRMRIWRWKADFDDLLERHRQDRDELIAQINYWKHISERFIGLTENQNEIIKVRMQDIEQIVEANTGLVRKATGTRGPRRDP